MKDLTTHDLAMERNHSSGEDCFSRFCLSLISTLNDYNKRQAHAAAPPAPEHQNPVLAKKLMLAEKMLKLRMLENDDATQLIISELESHMENLKGGYLAGIIQSIRSSQSRI